MSSRTNPAMPKRPKEVQTQIQEAPSYQQKKTCFSPFQSTIGSATLKSLRPQYYPPGRKVAAKPSSGGHSPNRNSSSKESSSDQRGKGSPEVERCSRKWKGRNDSCTHNGDTSEVFSGATNGHSASSSSSAGHQDLKVYRLEAQYGKMRISCSEDGNKSPCNDRGMVSPGQTLPKDSQVVELESAPPEAVPEDLQRAGLALLLDLVDAILGHIKPMREVMKLRSELGRAFRDAIHRPAFLLSRPDSEGEFSPSFFMTDEEGDLHWYGFDTNLREWTHLPSLNFAKKILPSPDPDLFKDYLVAGDGGLLCINVGKAPGGEKLVICNPLTHEVKVLPPLNYARHPVLIHLKVDDKGHYKVIVAGSAAIGSEAVSLKTEEYDSRKGVWECPDGSDLPCPPFGLNEYQNGVYFKDSGRELLLCVAIVDTRGRGVLVYDIKKKQWLQGPQYEKLHIPLVRSEPNVSHLATTQIVECGGTVFVFSEQECGRDVYFLIHKLSLDGSGDFAWEETMRRKRTGGRGLLVYPEFTCVPVSEHELCIFNTVEHTIEIIDLDSSTEVTLLQASSPIAKGNRFHSLNPIGFVFKPSFRSNVCPRGQNPEFRCDLQAREYCSECERRDSEVFIRSPVPMHVGPEVITHPACIEGTGPKVLVSEVSAPTEVTNTTANFKLASSAADITSPSSEHESSSLMIVPADSASKGHLQMSVRSSSSGPIT